MRCRRGLIFADACVNVRTRRTLKKWKHSINHEFTKPQSLHVPASRASAVELATPQPTELSAAASATYLNRSVNRNETIETQDTLVVMGDCQRGSIVRSESSIIVLGRYGFSEISDSGCAGISHLHSV